MGHTSRRASGGVDPAEAGKDHTWPRPPAGKDHTSADSESRCRLARITLPPQSNLWRDDRQQGDARHQRQAAPAVTKAERVRLGSARGRHLMGSDEEQVGRGVTQPGDVGGNCGLAHQTPTLLRCLDSPRRSRWMPVSTSSSPSHQRGPSLFRRSSGRRSGRPAKADAILRYSRLRSDRFTCWIENQMGSGLLEAMRSNGLTPDSSSSIERNG